MAYNGRLADRVREQLLNEGTLAEKKMMGGLCFMIGDKMCAGIIGDDLMLRVDPEIYPALLEKHGCREMKFTGRPMKGYVLVEEEAMPSNEDLAEWIALALEFNPRARSSKRKAV
jgi:TfoX/Sxy family transcriptional regulator of competence genes